MDDFPLISPFVPFRPILPIPLIGLIPIIPPIEPAPLVTPIRPKDPAASKFFLPPFNHTDDMVFRGPVRDAMSVTPLIDGQEIFKALETAISKAEKSVLMAFWFFDPTMKLVTDTSATWEKLLLDSAGRGVKVRVLLNDFDPGFQFVNHRDVWAGYRRMQKAASSVSTDAFQMVCSHHPAETSDTIVAKIEKGLFDRIVVELNKIADPNVRTTVVGLAPGIWDKVNIDLRTGAVSPKAKGKDYPARPAVHHQKLVIVDAKVAFTGGLNVAPPYLDSRKHEKPELPWHDVFVKVEGSFILKDFVRNYVGSWNQERARMDAFVTNQSKALGVPVAPFRTSTDLALKDFPAPPSPSAAKIPSQVHRTITSKGTDPTGIPNIVRQDVIEGYLQAIAQAKQYIYLENQYFREEAVANAIIQQHKAVSDLRTIILLPKLIEEFLKGKGDKISQHGAALQFELLEKMTKEIGANLGLFTLVRKDNSLIYVHSKLFIIDDQFASIGSANCNPRSFKVDTELDLTWFDVASAKHLRVDLWNEVLGSPPLMNSWKPKEYVKKWEAIAKKNITGPASAQKGFVIPFTNNTKGERQTLLEAFANLSIWT